MITALAELRIRTAVPALTLSVTMARLSEQRISEVLGLIDILPHMRLAAVETLDDVQHLALVVRHLEQPLDISAAHAAAVALHWDWSVVTVDRRRWDAAIAELPYPLTVVELGEPPAGASGN